MTSASASNFLAGGVGLNGDVFKEIVEQSLIGTFLVENQKIVYASPRCAEIFGRSIEELIGLSIDQVVHPDDRKDGNERMRQRAAGREVSAPYAIRGLRPDGSIRELETQTALRTIGGRQLVMISIIDATERNRTQRILNQMAEAVGLKVGQEFFSSLVLNLARNLNVDYAFVAEICPDQRHLRMIAVAADGATAEPVTYRIADTPCETVINTSLCWYPSGVQQLYPKDRFLMETGVDSYAGIPLKDSGDRPIGLISIMNRGELLRDRAAEATLEVYSIRASAELERRLAERSVIAAREYLDYLLESANVMIVELDTRGYASRVNRMTEEITGYRRGELQGRNWFELLMPPQRRIHAEAYLNNLREGRLPLINESPILTRDGGQRMIAWRNSAVRNQEGDVVGSLSFGVDITERVQAAEERAQLQKELTRIADEWRGTFDAVNTPILLTESSGKIVRVNRAARELSGLAENRIAGLQIGELGAGEPWQTAAQMVKYIFDERAGTSAETRDDLGRTWDITIVHFSGAPEHSERFILVFWDITGIVELQESLRRSETMSAMGTVVAGVAHEVRNPLFGISATLDAFAEELSLPGYAECASALRSEVTRLTHLMQELLEYGRPSTLNIEREDLHQIVAEAVRTRTHFRSDVKIENAIPLQLPKILMDRARMCQVFLNLIDNAAHHAPAGSKVRVTGSVIDRAGRPWIECDVEDDGPGFAREDVERAFEPFFTRREGGTGLGLSIVQRIVLEHSGRVFAENRDEGGARIRVLLPVAESGSAK